MSKSATPRPPAVLEEQGSNRRTVAQGSSQRQDRKRIATEWTLFLAILVIGIFARTWELNSVPQGMYPDEYSVSVDSYSLLHFGVDRNLVSFPVALISWGEGTSALYAYLSMPFMALGGASPFTYRLPMLISGILTLPLIYLIARRLGDSKLGLMAMFLLAISPWHIMMSRWALECNILPFVFSIGFLLLLKSLDDLRWFMPAMGFMALSLYAYTTAYAAIPIFLILAVTLLITQRRLTFRAVLPGLLVFLVLATPIAMFLVVNTLHLESVRLGPITIPRLPSTPRFDTVLSPLSRDFLEGLGRNAGIMIRLLVTELDSHIFNTVSPYGYLYRYTFPLAVIGAAVLVHRGWAREKTKPLLLMAWLAAAVSLGFLQDVNVNRINLVFIPLILCAAACLDWLGQHSKVVLYSAIAAFLIVFGFFNRDYHGAGYRAASAEEFWAGALPAIDFASQQGAASICVTEEINYIVPLFAQAMHSAYHPQELRYDRPQADIRLVPHLFPYTFGLQRCSGDPAAVYVLTDEAPPGKGVGYSTARFGMFTVYIPQPASVP